MKLSNGIIVLEIPSLSLTEDQQENLGSWIEALRSGKYSQGEGHLRTKDDSYCCMGVGCDVYRSATGLGKWVRKGRKYFFDYTDDKSSFQKDATMPSIVGRYFGIEDDFMIRIRMTEKSRAVGNYGLMTLNDARYATFSEIADILEVAMMGGLSTPFNKKESKRG